MAERNSHDRGSASDQAASARSTVLNDIEHLLRRRSEVVSVIGPSGGGKSTFLRCLNLLETPTAGQVLVDGADICRQARGRGPAAVRRWAWCFSSSICLKT